MSLGVKDIDQLETQEWLDSLVSLHHADGGERVQYILDSLQQKAAELGVTAGYPTQDTRYINTIPAKDEPQYPGDEEVEEKIEAIIRWNAAVMVAHANKQDGTLGGHIGSFASSCTFYEVGQNHFFHAPSEKHGGDLIFFQGHVSPGMYARAYLEGRITEKQMHNFRREVDGEGLSSYPHPWLMPNFWQFPTVSMGLGPLQAIYQARFMKYLNSRQITETENRKVWAFCGDGEMDEPESLGAITRAGREKLDNLIFVINCNLQRLDGLVNGNGKIVQELAGVFAGANWHVIKVLWGSNWQPLFDQDDKGLLQQRLAEINDGQLQTAQAHGGSALRELIFGGHPELKAMVKDWSDEDIEKLQRGGHDRKKLYAAYQNATKHKGQPVVILAHAVKGYGLGRAGESLNIAHNAKKLSVEELKYVRDRFNVPVSDAVCESMSQYLPEKDSNEIKYLQERRQALGGYLPARHTKGDIKLDIPHYEEFGKQLLKGSGEREMSTTTAFVRILTALAKDKQIGKRVVPIVPDESRTFGMEGLFRTLGIYNPAGQNYIPEDKAQVMYYKEATDGQILQEGINEAGAFSAWIAAATSYSVHHEMMIPFYIYYSMFGFQRIADLAWAAGDSRARGFLLGGTAGRTTLNGEGLQHEDGHSHVMSELVPNCHSYDPTYAYELAIIVHHGMKRMYAEHHDEYYYITVMNENYVQPEMPKGCEEGVVKGLYVLKEAKKPSKTKHVQLMGSGTILREVEQAAELLEENFGVTSTVWSMTSANNLYRDGLEVTRHNQMNPEAKTQKEAYITSCLKNQHGPVIAATDYVKLYTEKLRDFIPNKFVALGTDGYGRSDTRAKLREHFEVDAAHVAYAALYALYEEGQIKIADLKKARETFGIDKNKHNPISL